jgi:H+/gluconate symporter-like permease
MVPVDTHHDHPHTHGHHHHHATASPHPAQVAPWSILRMPVVTRLGAALIVCTVLWAVVLLSMR